MLAIVLGAANAYLGLKAGMTVAATFPAAVIAIAFFRLPWIRGSVLEQNIARTTATVGEALVAAAIFTLPAFVLAKVDGRPLWEYFHYWESVIILAAGGVLGLLFIILLRRTLTVDAGLPFPESVACYDIVRAGQGHDAGARFVFGSSLLGMLFEVLKNPAGIAVYKDMSSFLMPIAPRAWMSMQTPLISPALLSVGYIIGPHFASLTALGSALAWFGIVPAIAFFTADPQITALSGDALNYHMWEVYVRPIALGTMFMASLATLWGLRDPIRRALRNARQQSQRAGTVVTGEHERDLSPRGSMVAAAFITLPLSTIFYFYCYDVLSTLIMAAVLFVLSFLLSIIGAWLVGLVGSSNQPVSGVTLTAIIITGTILLVLNVGGVAGVGITLVTAVIICAAAALSGTLIQELKVGQLLGATPWKMQVAQIIGTIIVAFVCVSPMIILHEGAIAQAIAAGQPALGIGGPSLPAPQASLMAQVATAILGGTIAWNMVGIGLIIGLLLIATGMRGTMVVAVGMYLSIDATLAIFLGGMCKLLLDYYLENSSRDRNERAQVQNRGTLIASGLIAGEAIAGVLLAGIVLSLLKTGAAELSLATLLGITAHHDIITAWGTELSVAVLMIVGAVLVWLPFRNRAQS